MKVQRRRMLRTVVAAMAAAALPGRTVAQESDAATPGLVAGGGAVETPLGTVDFALAAQPAADGTLAGVLTLTDFTQPGNPVVIQSSQLNRLEAVDDAAPSSRRLVGWVAAGGQTALFLLDVSDLGGPGSGEDTFAIQVGEAAAPFLEGEEQRACDCAGFSYSLEGPVVAGDIVVTDP